MRSALTRSASTSLPIAFARNRFGPTNPLFLEAPRDIDLGLATANYSECGAGGGFALSLTQDGYDASGRPRVLSFLSTAPRSEVPPGTNCSAQVQGLLFGRLALEEPQNFYTVAPCRVLDTRNQNGAFGGPAIAANSERSFAMVGQCGLPSGAKSVSLNVTVTQPTAGGSLRIFQSGITAPGAMAISYSAGQTRANNAVIGLSSAGALTVRANQGSGSVHVIIDVNGYFQ